MSKRLQILQEHFTLFLYTNVCRSLFEKDKLLFAFSLAVHIGQAAGTVAAEQYKFLLIGGWGGQWRGAEHGCEQGGLLGACAPALWVGGGAGKGGGGTCVKQGACVLMCAFLSATGSMVPLCMCATGLRRISINAPPTHTSHSHSLSHTYTHTHTCTGVVGWVGVGWGNRHMPHLPAALLQVPSPWTTRTPTLRQTGCQTRCVC